MAQVNILYIYITQCPDVMAICTRPVAYRFCPPLAKLFPTIPLSDSLNDQAYPGSALNRLGHYSIRIDYAF